MKIKIFYITILFLILCVPALALAQGWGWNSNYNRLYDVNTDTTTSRTISEIAEFSLGNNCPFGTALMINTNGDVKIIHLGPAWYLDNQEIKFSVGEKVEVIGSEIKYDNEDVIIAREITREDGVLILRDKDGFPYWAGWRRR